MASSLTEATVGMIITPMMRPAPSALNEPMPGKTPSLKNVVKMDRYAQAASRTFITRSRTSLAPLLRFQAFVPDLVPPSSTTENPPKPRDRISGGSAAVPTPLCYKQYRSGTSDYCDCCSAVSRSPPFGSPSALNTVPVVRSSYRALASCDRLPGSVTYLAASTIL